MALAYFLRRRHKVVYLAKGMKEEDIIIYNYDNIHTCIMLP
jgi:hypothetical protein